MAREGTLRVLEIEARIYSLRRERNVGLGLDHLEWRQLRRCTKIRQYWRLDFLCGNGGPLSARGL